MTFLERNITKIYPYDLKDVDEMFFRQIGMSGDKVLKKFRVQFNETKETVLSNVDLKCVYMSCAIEATSGDTIFLRDFPPIVSTRLSIQFAGALEIGLLGVTLIGYDKLEEREKNSLKVLFLDGWGTALVECAYAQMRDNLAEELKKRDLYTTCFWSPGQHEVDIKLQDPVFQILRPQEIGITLNSSYMMHPKKSITGLFGIRTNKLAEDIRPCDICPLRESCPSAYS